MVDPGNSPLTAKRHPENLYSKRSTMAALNQLDFEQEEPLASDEQFLGEELRKELAEEKRARGRMILFTLSASLALWAIIFFVASRFL